VLTCSGLRAALKHSESSFMQGPFEFVLPLRVAISDSTGASSCSTTSATVASLHSHVKTRIHVLKFQHRFRTLGDTASLGSTPSESNLACSVHKCARGNCCTWQVCRVCRHSFAALESRAGDRGSQSRWECVS
jgi:hypothetical protein